MSQHPSLRSQDKNKKDRSVLKRYERVGALKEKEKWKEGSSVFGLAKVKIIKFKIKKEKAAPAEEAEAAAAPGAGTAAPAASQDKAASGGTKAAGGKEGAKAQGKTGPEKK